MKTTLLSVAFVVLSLDIATAQPQLIFETTTPSSFVLVGDGDVKIMTADYTNGENYFTLYNLDNTVFRQVALPAGAVPGNVTHISYVTLSLFDCDDSNVEYVYFQPGSNGNPLSGIPPTPPHTRVVAEDGTVILDLPDYSLYEGNSDFLSLNSKNIVDHPDGAVMNVTEGMHGHHPRKYFRLCGHLPTMHMREMGELVGITEYGGGPLDQMILYPNPAQEQLRVSYILPVGHRSGQLRIIAMDGTLVKQLLVSNTVDHIMLDVSALPAGTYMLNILLDNGRSTSERFVKVNRK